MCNGRGRKGLKVKAMDEAEFDGTDVLEKIASINRIDEFFEALDADNFDQIKYLMKRAGLDADTRAWVIKKMKEA